jgi:hypothetical protein
MMRRFEVADAHRQQHEHLLDGGAMDAAERYAQGHAKELEDPRGLVETFRQQLAVSESGPEDAGDSPEGPGLEV